MPLLRMCYLRRPYTSKLSERKKLTESVFPKKTFRKKLSESSFANLNTFKFVFIEDRRPANIYSILSKSGKWLPPNLMTWFHEFRSSNTELSADRCHWHDYLMRHFHKASKKFISTDWRALTDHLPTLAHAMANDSSPSDGHMACKVTVYLL